jgi:Gpi18-like mannosyltransferase
MYYLTLPVIILSTASLFLALLLLCLHLNLSNSGLALAFTLAAVAMVARVLMIDFRSGDYNSFLGNWVQYFRDNGGFSALKSSIGDYNFPYLYFLSFFSYLPVDDLYLIKFLSIFADILLAFYSMKLVSHFTKNENLQFLTFFIILLLPTVCLNSAKWAQCDSIYVLFAVMSVYYMFKNKPLLAVSMIAVSFSFKLQAIFILPIFAAFVITGRLKLHRLFAFPAVFLLAALPAIIAGRAPLDSILIYFNQTGSYSSHLSLNAPSIFAFIQNPPANTALYSIAGIILAAVSVFAVLFVCYIKKKEITDRHLLELILFLSVSIPFFLPSMHERYFYPADVFSVICAISLAKNLFVPALVQFASWVGYDAYLTGYYRLNIRFGATAVFLALAAVAVSVYNDLFRGKPGAVPDSASPAAPPPQTEAPPPPRPGTEAKRELVEMPEPFDETTQALLEKLGVSSIPPVSLLIPEKLDELSETFDELVEAMNIDELSPGSTKAALMTKLRSGIVKLYEYTENNSNSR